MPCLELLTFTSFFVHHRLTGPHIPVFPAMMYQYAGLRITISIGLLLLVIIFRKRFIGYVGIAIEVIRVTEFDSEVSFDFTGHFKAILVS